MTQTLSRRLASGALDDGLIRLYGPARLEAARARYGHVLEGFERTFSGAADAFFTAPGRTELGGNHTDHQHGRVLAAAVDLDILAAVRRTDSGVLRMIEI